MTTLEAALSIEQTIIKLLQSLVGSIFVCKRQVSRSGTWPFKARSCLRSNSTADEIALGRETLLHFVYQVVDQYLRKFAENFSTQVLSSRIFFVQMTRAICTFDVREFELGRSSISNLPAFNQSCSSHQDLDCRRSTTGKKPSSDSSRHLLETRGLAVSVPLAATRKGHNKQCPFQCGTPSQYITQVLRAPGNDAVQRAAKLLRLFLGHHGR